MLETTNGRLAGKNLLITGGAGRIGAAVAKSALLGGANVVLADIAAERLEDCVNNLTEFCRANSIHGLPADIRTESGIKSLIDEAFAKVGPLTSAVHCAYPRSTEWGCPFEKLKSSFLNEDLSSQLGGAILFSQQILRHFQANNGGDLIHISSIQGVCAPKFEHYQETSMSSPIEYAAIKSGIISITRWLAKYYSNQNIRVNCVSPGGILDNQPQQFLLNYRKSCTNFGMLESHQVSSIVTFLMSPEAEAINGQNLIVDDGWSI